MPFLYALVVPVGKDEKIQIGKLGELLFRKGWYVYVGSANSGIWRIRRHFRREKKLRWHIDYLASVFPPALAYAGHFRFPECSLARRIAEHGEMIHKGFGSSDTECFSHLIYFRRKKDMDSALDGIGFENLLKPPFGHQKS